MITAIVHFLEVNILPMGAFGVFLASVLEEVFAPIPSALIMTMSGFLFVKGDVSFVNIISLLFKVAFPAALGVTIGSYFIFYIAKYGGELVINKFGKYIGLYWSDIVVFREKMSGTNRDELFIVIARIIPIVPSVAISAVCGILNMNVFKYFFITLIGVFIRGIFLGIVGWQVGNVYEKYADIFSSIEKIVLLSTLFIVLVFIVLKYRHNIKK